MAEKRIQKLLSEQGYCSRRAAEQLINEGRVKVNGHPVKLGDKMDERDAVSVDGMTLTLQKQPEKLYYMLHKPRGFVTTLADERGRRCVSDLVSDIGERLVPVGRLDLESEGLLIMTNDGEFVNALTHPSRRVAKLYRVTTRPEASEEQLIALATGVKLDDGTLTAPANVRALSVEPGRSVLEITLREGKNREIRRMCESVGLQTIRLRRTALGPLKLGMLQPGKYRELTKQEVASLKKAAGMK